MELKDVIEARASVRRFTDEEVCNDDLREMVRLAHLAPSVNNSQPWRFIAIKNRKLLEEMAAAVHSRIMQMLPESNDDQRKIKEQVDWFSTFFGTAPAVIAVLLRPYEAVVDCALGNTLLSHDAINAMRGHPDIESIGAAIENLLLAAQDMGYGACWLSGPIVARDELERMLDIREPWRLAAMVAVGRPASPHKQREKKPLDEVFELIT